MITDEKMSMKRMATEALLSQSASNLSGVVHMFSRVVSNLWHEANKINEGTRWVNNHPVSRLFASQIHYLSGMGLSETKEYREAYEECKRLAGQD